MTGKCLFLGLVQHTSVEFSENSRSASTEGRPRVLGLVGGVGVVGFVGGGSRFWVSSGLYCGVWDSGCFNFVIRTLEIFFFCTPLSPRNKPQVKAGPGRGRAGLLALWQHTPRGRCSASGTECYARSTPLQSQHSVCGHPTVTADHKLP